ncbi:hypothetical protein HMPREF9123_2487 [Neisseria bacilliformis ATCC BAA-1200]|uniref:Uncharacterized protein n=1 Tax=Neisseria bacilliformis ATCC BAA-1200 TaxID=888742 RepID=F2BFI0_9NEIS|nr:hypothetical protein HMPREF9123_2487 [Neisseria bacilliformis ATCC BAA-1200]
MHGGGWLHGGETERGRLKTLIQTASCRKKPKPRHLGAVYPTTGSVCTKQTRGRLKFVFQTASCLENPFGQAVYAVSDSNTRK